MKQDSLPPGSREPDGREEDQIEGIDEPIDDEPWKGYPIDSLHIRQETRTIYEVVRRIRQGNYIMDPEFQRDFVWDTNMQSRLIESVLMRIPLPVIYLAENHEGKLVIVDGLQRLTTFKRFLEGELVLALHHEELDGKSFDKLSPKLQNRIEDAQLILYIIDAEVPDRAKLDIFNRVNSSMPLTRQQMRNCLYLGPATRWLRNESRTDLFREVTGNSLPTETMRDREVVNRFCSFALLGPQAHSGDLDDFLGAGLKKMNELDEPDLDQLGERFHRSLENNLQVFGKHAFRKHEPGQRRRSPFNVALFDAFSVLLADRDPGQIQAHAGAIHEGFFEIMKDERFVQAISQATSSPGNVKIRFEKVGRMLVEVLDADQTRAG